MALKENYKDDILDVSVNTKRKYRVTENQDGTISLDDETVYTQEGDSFGASDMNAVGAKVNELDTELDTVNDNLSGFKFYPAGTGIVGLIADDSAYTDEDGNYVVWGTATANQLVADNPNTYKSVPSEEDTRGKEGEDTAMSFGGGSKTSNPIRYGIYSKTTSGGSDSISQNTVPDSELVVISFVVGSGRYASSWTFGVNLNISGGNYEEVYSDSANQVTSDSTTACEVRGIYKVIRKEKGTQLAITGNITNIGNNKKCGAMLTITEF